MTPNYVVRKSAWGAVTFWRVVLFWLIIPLIIMIIDIINLKCQRVEFYDNHVIIKTGVLSRNENKSVFPAIESVTSRQSLWGRIFNYGDVFVDVVGRWDINLRGICNPEGLKAYLSDKTIDGRGFAPTFFE